jgi:hypothetical protein
MSFANWTGDGIDVYMRNSTWEIDLWSHYTIEDQSEPADWHMARSMKFVGSEIWTIEELYTKSKKRGRSDISSTEEEPLSEEAAINQTAVNAMTPVLETMPPTAIEEEPLSEEAAINQTAVNAMTPVPETMPPAAIETGYNERMALELAISESRYDQ